MNATNALLIVLLFGAAAPTHAADRIKVFVTSAATDGGFTDPSKDNRDTVKDLQSSIRDQKNLALTETRDDATIVLTVMGRQTAQVTAGFMGAPARDRMIRVKFTCGSFETEMSASAQGGTLGSGGAWGKAAKKIAKQVSQWVDANRDKLSTEAKH